MRKNIFLYLILILSVQVIFAQGFWTQKASIPIAGRHHSSGFSVNGKGYYIFGCGSGFHNSVNLIEYDPALNTWTSMPDFPGGTRINGHVFVLGSYAFNVSGAYWSGISNDYTCYNDVWRYNVDSSTWVQLDTFPGTPRHGGFAFSYNGKGYFGLGIDDNLNYLNDFWQYDPLTDHWAQMSPYPGVARKSGFAFSIWKDGYVGMGYDITGTTLTDVWKYDAALDQWTQMNNFPGAGRCWVSNFTMNGKGYVVAGSFSVSPVSYTTQFWEYDPVPDTWQSMPALSGAARACAAGFSISGKGYTGTGSNGGGYLIDFWEFTPSMVAIEDATGNSPEMAIFPNPAREYFIIDLPLITNAPRVIEIVDASGRTKEKFETDRYFQQVQIDCSAWEPGIYFIHQFVNEKHDMQTLIKD
jgi:N-acetylneuraminic acid mutarotase